jgi:hypothetical protein
VEPDAVLDEIRPDGTVLGHRFSGGGTVEAVGIGPEGHLWVATRAAGLLVRVEGEWLRPDRPPLPGLAALAFGRSEAWLGSAGAGLAHLAPAARSFGGVEPADPFEPPPLVHRYTERIYLPIAHRARDVPFEIPLD